MVKSKLSISDQIIKALDGRTQRWLSFEARIGEAEISKKLKGKLKWTDEELGRIEERLNFKIERPNKNHAKNISAKN